MEPAGSAPHEPQRPAGGELLGSVAAEPVGPLETMLGYRFRRRDLLELALTHPSVTHDLGNGTPHNQRLEFLGDAVLQLVITSELYENFPAFGEGPLTQARAEMVNRRTLAHQSAVLGIGRFLRMSRSEESTGGRDRASALADAFEAVIGAIYLDGGLEPARTFILRRFHGAFGQLEALPSIHNPKGDLQELLQAESAEGPSYHLLSMNGPDHDRVFECAVIYRGETLGHGVGKSKKAAESEAARLALILLRARTAAVPLAGPDARPDVPSENA